MYFDMDSFGQDCPMNWEQIADYLNSIIEDMEGITDEFGEVTPDGREQIDNVWENYWGDYHSGTLPENAPVPVIE